MIILYIIIIYFIMPDLFIFEHVGALSKQTRIKYLNLLITDPEIIFLLCMVLADLILFSFLGIILF